MKRRSVIYIKLEPVDDHPKRRRLLCTINHNATAVEIDITDVNPVELAMSKLDLRGYDDHLIDYITDALQSWIDQELVEYLEGLIRPHGYFQPMYDTIDLIQRQYRAEFGGDQ